jgi:Protein of unknown function (DUF732)
MAALMTSRPWIPDFISATSAALRPLAVAAGVVAAAATLPALAHADPSTTALGGTGTGNNGALTDKIAGIGQSICPSLVKPGATLASVTSKLSGNSGLSPGIAEMVAGMAIQMECPGVMTSLAHGQMPNMPFPMQVPGAGPSPSTPFQPAGTNPLSQVHG